MDVTEIVSKAKKRNITPEVIKDEDGYYKILFGKFNTFNRGGIFYRVKDINAILGPGSLVARRIDDGVLINEKWHPETDGLSVAELRKATIMLDSENAVSTTKSIEIVNTGKFEPGFNLPIYYIYGWVKPSGPKKDAIIDLLDNPHANVPYSVRSMVSQSRVGSIFIRDVLLVSTWDHVPENGVKGATQWGAAGLEGLNTVIDYKDVKGMIAGFESNENMCEDGKCIINTLEKTMKDINKEDRILYEWANI